jgi:hypothetical protein
MRQQDAFTIANAQTLRGSRVSDGPPLIYAKYAKLDESNQPHLTLHHLSPIMQRESFLLLSCRERIFS